MSNSVFLYGLLFLFFMVFLAGAGIGLVIGFVLGNREKRSAALAPRADQVAEQALLPPDRGSGALTQSTFGDLLRSEQSGAPIIQPQIEVPQAPAAVAPMAQRRGQSWSVALAVAVMLVCCICVVLLAAAAMVNR